MPKSIVGLEWDHQRWAALLKLSKRVAKVDCKKAKSRNPEDKRKIDQYVKDGIGFAELNKKVKRAIHAGADRCRPDLFGDQYRRQGGEKKPDLRLDWTRVLMQNDLKPHRAPARPAKSDTVRELALPGTSRHEQLTHLGCPGGVDGHATMKFGNTGLSGYDKMNPVNAASFADGHATMKLGNAGLSVDSTMTLGCEGEYEPVDLANNDAGPGGGAKQDMYGKVARFSNGGAGVIRPEAHARDGVALYVCRHLIAPAAFVIHRAGAGAGDLLPTRPWRAQALLPMLTRACWHLAVASLLQVRPGVRRVCGDRQLRQQRR